MSLSRRQFLKMLPAGALGPALAPAAVSAAFPAAQDRFLYHYLRTGLLDAALMAGMATISAADDTRALVAVELQSQRGPARQFDDLVSELGALRDHGLLIVVPANEALWFDEALRELGASVLVRGEHALTPDGRSRHHWTGIFQGEPEMHIERRTGWTSAPASTWGALLGASLAAVGFRSGPLREPSVFSDSLNPISLPGTAAQASRQHLVSLVTRI